MYSYTNKTARIVAETVDSIGKVFFKKRPLIIARRDTSIKILIVKLDQIGDCFLSLPIFEYLKKIFPQASIDVICQDVSAQVFQGSPFINNILIFNYPRMYRGDVPANTRDFLSLIRTIRMEKYDISIDLRGEPFAALLIFLSGAWDRIGFEKEEMGGFFYTTRLNYDRNEHETKRYEKIVSLFDGITTVWRPHIYLTKDEVSKGETMIAGFSTGTYIAVHPGAGFDYNRWPKERFVGVIKTIMEHSDLDVVLLGGKGDAAAGDYIEDALRGDRLKNKIGQLSLRESYFVISHAKAFLGNDSVLAHFAGALDVPTIDLMNAAVNEERWRPLGEKSMVIKGKASGHECKYGACPYPCPNMEAIAINDVYRKLESIIIS